MSSTTSSDDEENKDEPIIGKSFLLMQEGNVEKHELQWDLKIIPGTGKSKRNPEGQCIIFKSGPLAHLKKDVLRVDQVKVAMLLEQYNEETGLFTVAVDGQTMRVLKGQIDFYTKGKMKDSHELLINEPVDAKCYCHQNQNLKLLIMGAAPAFTATQLNVDMMRFRVFLQVENGSVEGISFLGSCVKAKAPNMFLSEHLSDIRVVCVCSDGNKSEASFPAHRFVLASNSPVFDRMFRSDMKEAREGRIVIEDMSEASLKELLRFMYTGVFVVTDDITFELFKTADKYDMGTLKNQCEEFLLQRLSIQNAVDVYQLGEVYECDSLKEKSFHFIMEHRRTIFEDEGSLVEFCKKSPKLFKLFHDDIVSKNMKKFIGTVEGRKP